MTKRARKRILLTGNNCFKIANFREGLIRALVADGHEVLVLAPFDAYRSKLEDMGCKVHDLFMVRNGTAPLAELALLFRIYEFLRHERPEIVFGYTIKNNIYAGMACRALRIPFVPNVTGLGPAFNTAGALNRIVRFLYRVAFSRAQVVFFQNPDDRALFVAAGLISTDKAQLLPGSGVDLERFQAEALPAATEPLTFLLVARLLWEKGVGHYVDAARRMRAQNPTLRFNLLGSYDPSSRSSISRSQVEAWVEEGSIVYLGEMQDVRPSFASAHCIVLPSWYREGTPRVLLEAAAVGRPVITTDMPGCRDAVEHERTGFICAPQDCDALVAAMERFVVLPQEDRAAMGQAARARAEAEFDEHHVISAYLQLLPK